MDEGRAASGTARPLAALVLAALAATLIVDNAQTVSGWVACAARGLQKGPCQFKDNAQFFGLALGSFASIALAAYAGLRQEAAQGETLPLVLGTVFGGGVAILKVGAEGYNYPDLGRISNAIYYYVVVACGLLIPLYLLSRGLKHSGRRAALMFYRRIAICALIAVVAGMVVHHLVLLSLPAFRGWGSEEWILLPYAVIAFPTFWGLVAGYRRSTDWLLLFLVVGLVLAGFYGLVGVYAERIDNTRSGAVLMTLLMLMPGVLAAIGAARGRFAGRKEATLWIVAALVISVAGHEAWGLRSAAYTMYALVCAGLSAALVVLVMRLDAWIGSAHRMH